MPAKLVKTFLVVANIVFSQAYSGELKAATNQFIVKKESREVFKEKNKNSARTLIYNHIKATKGLSEERVWDVFPFDTYLKLVAFDDLEALVDNGAFIERRGRKSHLFYLKQASFFVKGNSVTSANALSIAKTGNDYINYQVNSRVPAEDKEILKTIGYFLLGKVAAFVEEQKISVSQMEKRQEVRRLYEILKANKVFIELEQPSRISKCLSDIRRCASRVTQAAQWYALKALGRKQYPITSERLRDNALVGVDAYTINRGAEEIGKAFVFDRGRVNIGYRATRLRTAVSLKRSIQEYAKNHGELLIAIAAGGFTTASGQPDGLTFQDGRIVNAALGPRHGLIIIESSGAIRTCHLKEGLRLPGIDRKIMPLTSIEDYYYLVQWLKNNKASTFQTYLLAHGNRFLLREENVPTTSTERRFFAAIRDTSSAQLSAAIIDIPASNDMYHAAQDAFSFLSSKDGRSAKIEFLIYLDVGAYDIFEVYERSGKIKINSKKNPSLATNLLFFTVKNYESRK